MNYGKIHYIISRIGNIRKTAAFMFNLIYCKRTEQKE